MRPHRVVVLTPSFDEILCLAETLEDMLVETLVSESAVEAFDVAVLVRFARLDEAEPDFLLPGPAIQSHAHELRAVVHDDLFWETSSFAKPIQDPDDPGTRQGKVHLNGRRLFAELIHESQTLEGSPVVESIMNEIHSPDLIGPNGLQRSELTVLAKLLSLHPPHTQAFFAVDTADFLVIHLQALTPEQDVQTGISKARSLGSQGFEAFSQSLITRPPRKIPTG